MENGCTRKCLSRLNQRVGRAENPTKHPPFSGHANRFSAICDRPPERIKGLVSQAATPRTATQRSDRNFRLVDQYRHHLHPAKRAYSAIVNLERALQIYETLDNARNHSNCLATLAYVYKKKGNYVKAIEALEEGLRQRQARNDSAGLAHSYSELALIYGEQEDLELSRHYFELAIPLYRKGGAPKTYLLAGALGNAGSVYQRLGDMTTARQHLEEALKITRINGQQIAQIRILVDLSNLHRTLENPDSAYQYAIDGDAVATQLGHPALLARAKLQLARLEHDRGNLAAARTQAEAGLEYALTGNTRQQEESANKVLTRIFEELGLWELAFKTNNRAHELHDSVQNDKN